MCCAVNSLLVLVLPRDFFVSAGEGEIASSPDWDDEEGVVTDLTFLGIVGIEDPVRPEVNRSLMFLPSRCLLHVTPGRPGHVP